MELAGPLTDPEVTLTHPGHTDVSLVFDGTVSAGDTLVIDTDAKTVLLNGTANRRELLVTASSRWFDLPPGNSVLTLKAASSGDGAGLRATWRDAYQ